MKRTYLSVSAAHHNTDRKKVSIDGAIKRLNWVKPEGEFPMLPIEAIKTAIREFKIPRVTKIAIGTLGRYGFYGIEGNYKNGRGVLYVLDKGSVLLPVISDFYPIEEPKPEGETAPAAPTRSDSTLVL